MYFTLISLNFCYDFLGYKELSKAMFVTQKMFLHVFLILKVLLCLESSIHQVAVLFKSPAPLVVNTSTV